MAYCFYLTGDDELGSHVSNLKLIGWLEKQLEQAERIGLQQAANSIISIWCRCIHALIVNYHRVGLVLPRGRKR